MLGGETWIEPFADRFPPLILGFISDIDRNLGIGLPASGGWNVVRPSSRCDPLNSTWVRYTGMYGTVLIPAPQRHM